MEAKELMIGNYVQNENHPSEVLRVDIELLEAINNKSLSVEQIDLTEDWLIKFGLTKDKSYPKVYVLPGTQGDANEVYCHGIFFDSHVRQWSYQTDRSDAGCYTLTYINYVNELQILVFSLSGVMLEVK